MPVRTRTRIRRDLNRPNQLIADAGQAQPQPPLAVLQPDVSAATQRVNDAFQNFQQVSVNADRDRAERDEALGSVVEWTQQWRPIVMLKIPGASDNISRLPSSGATPDDQIRVARDLHQLITSNPAAESFREAALAVIGDSIENAEKESNEAALARPAEDGAREALTEATLAGNELLVRSLEVVRAIFGPTSPQYKQFVVRSTSDSDAKEEDQEANVGEVAAE